MPEICFRPGSAPDPVGGAHDTPPDLLVGWEGKTEIDLSLDFGVPNFIFRKLANLMLLRKLFLKSCIEKVSTFKEYCNVCYRICYRFKAGSSYSFMVKMEYLMKLKN